MKVTLTYDGPLHSNGNPERKWRIRNQLHPQLEELWTTNVILKTVRTWSIVPKNAGLSFRLLPWPTEEDVKRLKTPDMPVRKPNEAEQDLCAPIIKNGRSFIPLVRDSLDLTCSLDILFLKKERLRPLNDSGDIDNRLKTLFDALQIPDDNQSRGDTTKPPHDPVYCLLENDRLVSDVAVRTGRLLGPQENDNHVRLVIDVAVKITHVNPVNVGLLGD